MKLVTSTSLYNKKKGFFYLGFWCFKNLNFKSIYKNTKKICKNNITQKKLDSLQYISNNKKKKFSKLLSIIIQKELNLSKKHNLNILIGHWVHQVIDILLNRYYTIDNIFKKNKIKEIYLLNFKNFNPYTIDSNSFNNLIDNPYFNDFIYDKYLELNQKKVIKIYYKKKIEPEKLIVKNNKNNSVKKLIKTFLSFVSFYLFKEYNYFFYRTYIPKETLKKLSEYLDQKSYFYNEYEHTCSKVNKNNYLRKNIIKKYSKKLQTNIDVFLLNMMIEIMPTNFLEGLKNNIEQSNYFLWPKNPKKIITSVGFGGEDMFCTWLMNKKIKFSNKFVILQHGSNYITNKFHLNIVGEGLYSDYFLQWGNAKKKSKKIIDGYLFNIIGKQFNNLPKKTINNRILFVPNSAGLRKNLYDDTFKYIEYLFSLKAFFKNIDLKTSRLIDIKLHKNFKLFGFDELKIYKKELKINKVFTNTDIWDLSKQYKLIIFGYNSSGFYEHLSSNKPTIMFMPFPLSHLRKSVKKDFEKMIKLNLIFIDPLKMSNFISKNIKNIDQFFLKLKKNEDFKNFISKYARRNLDEIKNTALILKGK